MIQDDVAMLHPDVVKTDRIDFALFAPIVCGIDPYSGDCSGP